MSLVHMFLQKREEGSDIVSYEAVSIDFNEDREWKPIARLEIDKRQRDYKFEPLNEWREMQIIDPRLYDPKRGQDLGSLNTGEYGYCGAWSGRLHLWVNSMLREDNFPRTFPS